MLWTTPPLASPQPVHVGFASVSSMQAFLSVICACTQTEEPTYCLAPIPVLYKIQLNASSIFLNFSLICSSEMLFPYVNFSFALLIMIISNFHESTIMPFCIEFIKFFVFTSVNIVLGELIP